MRRLYIIGNGFDKAHNLKTSYWDFRCYLERYAEDFLIEFEKLYGFYPFDADDYHIAEDRRKDTVKRRNNALREYLWNSFEEKLGTPLECEIESICDTAVDAMSEFEFGGIEDTLDAYFEEQFQFIQLLQNYLLKWVKQIRLHKAKVMRSSLLNNSTDLFLTFNYTPVLERIYHISSSQICHIHGGTPPYCLTPPIIGHGNRTAIEQRNQWKRECDEVFDEGGASTHQAFVNYYQRTFKDVNKIILMNPDFFSRIRDINQVQVIGHSLGAVDIPYFKEINVRANENTSWIVYYHSDAEKDAFEKALRGIGVKRINMRSSTSFWV